MSWAGRRFVHRRQVPFLPGSLGAFPQAGAGFRWARGGPGGAGGDGQERVGEHRQGDVPVPGAVLADLVVVQAGLILGLGEAVLNSHLAPATAASSGRLAGRGE